MADFTITIPASPDSDDHVMLLTAVLEGSVAITNTTTGKVEVQPWKPLGDGSRTDWENEEEVITWYKEINPNG